MKQHCNKLAICRVATVIMLLYSCAVFLSLSSPENSSLSRGQAVALVSCSVSFCTHPYRQTEPLSWSTARSAGCNSPPKPPAEPCHRKPPRTEPSVPQMTPDPGHKREQIQKLSITVRRDAANVPE